MNLSTCKLPWGAAAFFAAAQVLAQTPFRPEIPHAWSDEDIARYELPIVGAHSIEQVTAADYYTIPVRPIYKTYPIYSPEKEPAGYWQYLSSLDPVLAFDTQKLKTNDNWIRAGELVFEAPNRYTEASRFRDPAYLRESKWPIDSEGRVVGYRYVVREKGKVEFTDDSCASCHTRLLPDGRVVLGAQGNVPINRGNAYLSEHNRAGVEGSAKHKLAATAIASWFTPWAVEPVYDQLTMDRFEAHIRTIPPGDMQRLGTSLTYPIRIPDLIGVSDRKYLDSTGLAINRGVQELMRYAASNQTTYRITAYDGFRPMPNGREVSSRPLFRRAALCSGLIPELPPSAREPEQTERTIEPRQAGFPSRRLPCLPHTTSVHQQQTDAGPRLSGERRRRHPARSRRNRSLQRAQNPPRHRLLPGPLAQGRVVPRTLRAQWLRSHPRRLVRSRTLTRFVRPHRLRRLRSQDPRGQRTPVRPQANRGRQRGADRILTDPLTLLY